MRFQWTLVSVLMIATGCTGGAPREPILVPEATSTAVVATATVQAITSAATGQARVLELGVNAAQPILPAAAPPLAPAQPHSDSPPAPASVTIVPFTTSGGSLVSIADLEGAILQGGQGGITYLGVISSSRTNADSICNQNGAYGSAYSAMSVRNRSGEFGHIPSETSVYDPTAPLPPRILLKNARLGYLSKNIGLGRGVFDPDLVFAALGCA